MTPDTLVFATVSVVGFVSSVIGGCFWHANRVVQTVFAPDPLPVPPPPEEPIRPYQTTDMPCAVCGYDPRPDTKTSNGFPWINEGFLKQGKATPFYNNIYCPSCGVTYKVAPADSVKK